MSQKTPVAVCIHVYYQEMWDTIASYLKNIGENADYYITCRAEIYEDLSRIVLRDVPSARISILPNIGMDVLPFLMLCNDSKLHSYKAVLKLHTKNIKSELRAKQGGVIFDSLCGNAELVSKIVKIFEVDPHAGMIGSAFQIRSANALMYGNRARVQSLLDELDINIDDWSFFTGTMFWISGRLLRRLSAIAPSLAQQALEDGVARTGGDGTLPHALERIFGAVTAAETATIYVTERSSADADHYLVLPLEQHGPANSRELLDLDSTELLSKYVNAVSNASAIKDSEYFDRDYYAQHLGEFNVAGMDPLYHFVIYGDLLALDPSERFNVTYYQLRRQDAMRAGHCTLVHYVKHGRKDGTSTVPTEQDWRELAQRLGLFDAKRYKSLYPDHAMLGMEPSDHYWLIGERLGRAPSSAFDARKIPIALSLSGRSPVIEFLRSHYISERLRYLSIKRSVANGDFSLPASRITSILEKYGPTRPLMEVLAISSTLNGEWSKAREAWQMFWKALTRGEDTSRHGGGLFAQIDRPAKKLHGFESVEPRWSSLAKLSQADHKPRVCIYTALYGDRDNLPSIMNPADGIDYICFTDRPRDAQGWKQIIKIPSQPNDNLRAKIFKVLPHKYLKDYEYSMFVDANTIFLGRTGELVNLCINGGDFVMWQHPLRDDAYLEACAIITHRRHEPNAILRQIEHYSSLGFPRGTGMFEASFIWRRHAAPEIVSLMDQWWQEICEFSQRDQLSLSYLVWKTGTRPALLSASLGTSRRNRYFFKAPHTDASSHRPEVVQSDVLSPAVRKNNRNVAFLFSEKYAKTGSTVMRGEQLSGMVSAYDGGKFATRYTSSIDIENHVVVLTKGFLKEATPEILRSLGKNNILIADFVDDPVNLVLANEVDALMASSLLGLQQYYLDFPGKALFHVTHHTDTRLPNKQNASPDRFYAGYFGELANTVRNDEITPFVDFNLVDTSTQSTDWIDKIPAYNFHYAVRRTRGIDGPKPFLKGFTAAHFGANMMIQRSSGDAPFYLGSDYPYFVPDDIAHDEIPVRLQAAADSVGSREWHYALEIMRDVRSRSSHESVLREFDRMVSSF